MVIGIDIDDTIVDTSKKANEILHRKKKYQDMDDYHELPENIFESFVLKYISEIAKDEDIKDDVVSVLKEFKDMGIKLLFITARGGFIFEPLIPLTNLYFQKYNISYSEIIFSQNTKGLCAKKYNVDIFIDDKETILDEVKTYGIKTLKFSKNNEISKHEYVSNWIELKDYVKNYLVVKNDG